MRSAFSTRVTRRKLLQRAVAGAAGIGAMAVVGCGGSEQSKTPTPTSAATSSATPSMAAGSPTAIIAPAVWEQMSSAVMPSPRRDHTMTLDPASGLVYLFGGRRSGVSMNDLWVFDPKASAWREVIVTGQRPPARFAQVAIFDAARKRLVITTGQGDGSVFFNDVWSFDPSSNGWTELGAQTTDRPEIRYGAGGAFDSAGNRIFVSHGFTDKGRYDDTWSFDLAAANWEKLSTNGAAPIKRCLTRCVWLQSRQQILLFGGQTDATPFLGDFWSLDVAAGKWTEKKPAALPGARNLYGSGFDGKHWYIFGGNTPDGPTAETWKYDVASDVWTQVVSSPQPPARYSADAVIAGDSLYAFGGHDGNAELGDAWSLNLNA